MKWNKYIAFIYTAYSVLAFTDGCTLPASFVGTWKASEHGTITMNRTQIFNFLSVSSTDGSLVDAIGKRYVLDYVCVENNGSLYTFRSTEPINLFGTLYDVLMCLDIQKKSDTKMVYYKATNPDQTNKHFQIATKDQLVNKTISVVCNYTDYKQPYNYNIMIKSGRESSASILCPEDLFGTYTYNTCTTSSNTSMNVCETRKQLVFDYELCSTPQLFSREGILDCVFKVDGPVTYLTLYNRDSTPPDDSIYYQYVCLAVEKVGDTVFVTARPRLCLKNQNSTSIYSPGVAIQFTPITLCPITTTTTTTTEATTIATTPAPTDDSFDLVPILLAVIGVIVVIFIIILIVVCCCLKKSPKAKSEDEESIASSSETSNDDIVEKKDNIQSSRCSFEDERKSIDSGISETPTPAKTRENVNNETTETLIETKEEKDADEKGSRPRSGEPSRMSDLPPSEIPTEDELPVQDEHADVKVNEEELQKEHDEIKQEVEMNNEKDDEITPINEDTVIEEKTDIQEISKQDDKIHENEHEDKEENEDEEEEDDEEEEKVKQEEEGEEEEDKEGEEKEEERVVVNENTVKQNSQEKEQVEEQEEYEEQKVEQQEEHDDADALQENKEAFRDNGTVHESLEAEQEHKDVPDNEDMHELQEEQETHSDSSNAGSDQKSIGYDSDEDIEQGTRRHKLIGGKKDSNYLPAGGLTSVLISREEDEKKKRETKDKKKIKKLAKRKAKINNANKHIEKEREDDFDNTEDERVRHDPREAPFMKQYENKKHIEYVLDMQHYWSDPEQNKENDRLHGSTSSVYNSDLSSETDEEIIGPDGLPVKVRRSKRKKHMTNDVDDDISFADEEELRNQMLNKSRSIEDITSVEDVVQNTETDHTNRNEDDKVKNAQSGKGLRIRVKQNKTDEMIDEHSESDIGKITDRDSGLSEEENIDVILTDDQRQMIVNMLFDEDMQLRPQFYRNDDGQIVRRLDDTIIYDPRSGRFTLRKKMGQIFKVPRLQRNKKGRPTGGFINDEFGPSSVKVERKPTGSARSRRKQSGRTSTDSADAKRSRLETKNVGFSVPDEDTETLPADEDTLPDEQLEVNKRGRRDIASAIRRKLKKGLFKNKRKFGGSPEALPDIRVKRAWTDSPGNKPMEIKIGLLNPIIRSVTPQWIQKKGPHYSEQQQMYKEGLESDRKILERLQSRDGHLGSHGPFTDLDASQMIRAQSGPQRGYTYYSEDGTLVVRERGCPDLKKPQTPFFTKTRRPGDFEAHDNDVNTYLRPVKSAPGNLQVEDYEFPANEGDQSYTRVNTSDISLYGRNSAGSIDDYRLRILLEELYKDKKYLDRYVQLADETKSEEVLQSKGLAEHGRGYLLERADFWDKRPPPPIKPPMTIVGWKMQRQQQLIASRQGSQMGRTTMTNTPDTTEYGQEMYKGNVPGTVETIEENERAPSTASNNTSTKHDPNESSV